MTGTWPLGWQVGDIEIAAQYGKGIGSISDTTLGSPAATVDITSIVATYAHLLLVVYGRCTTAAAVDYLAVRFNGDTAASYDFQILQGSGASASAAEQFAKTLADVGLMPANTAGANLFGAAVAFIPHYAGSSNNKAVVGLSTEKSGTGGSSMVNHFGAAFWRSSAAINRITLLPDSASNFATGTRVTLFGMGA